MQKLIYQIYNPSTLSKEKLIKSFVVRLNTFQSIWEEIKTAEMQTPEQCILIEGQRGMGKTTLLLRLAYELENDKELNIRIFPVIFNEEEYGIDRLFKLWLRIAKILETNYSELFEGLFLEMDNLYPESFPEGRLRAEEIYEKQIFDLLAHKLLEKGKKIVLFIDNLGTLFGKFKEHELRRLRGILITCAEIRIIAATIGLSDEFLEYKAPFYEFFKVKRIRGLNKQEAENLLIMLGDELTPNPIPDILAQYPQRVETLRRLTGGVTRTLVMLFEFLISEKITSAFQDLEKILDRTTPLYKHRMDDLPQQQQTIVQAIAMAWDSISVKEIVQETRLESKTISAQLTSLVEAGIVDAIKPEKTKNYLYQLSERFFNIWYLMRFGGKNDRQRVIWLTRFYEAMLDPDALKDRIGKMKHSLQSATPSEHDSHYKYALALAEVNFVSEEDKMDIYQTTKTHFEKQGNMELAKKLGTYIEEIQEGWENEEKQAIRSLVDSILGEYKEEDAPLALLEEATKALEEWVVKDEIYTSFELALLYDCQDRYEKAEEYYLISIERGDINSLNNLGLIYFKQKKYESAEKYYLLAIEKGNVNALFNLGLLHDNQGKSELAEKYYLLAIEKENINALNNLANLHANQKKYELAEKYYLLAIEKGNVNALFNLGLLHDNQGKSELAEKYYLLAIAKEDMNALNNLANLYANQKKYELAEKYYLLAIEKEDIDALDNLGLLYANQEKSELAEKYHLLAIERGNINALDNLGLLYDDQKKYELAEMYYLLAIEKGNKESYNNLLWLYYQNGEKNKAIALYTNVISSENNIMMLNHTLSCVYLWLDEYEKALKIVEEGFLYDKAIMDMENDYIDFFLLLLAKSQYNTAYDLFTNEKATALQFKERFKPLYYTVLHYLQEKYAVEYLRMGSDLRETVLELAQRVEEMREKYN